MNNTIKQSVINTLKRVNIDYEPLINDNRRVIVSNWLSGETVETDILTSICINKIYSICRDYEAGIHEVNISDFDRLKYFVLERDRNAYFTCID